MVKAYEGIERSLHFKNDIKCNKDGFYSAITGLQKKKKLKFKSKEIGP